jgi:hypothetical protein
MRIEWVKYRLENWALWKAREGSGGLGFSSTTSFLHEVDTSRYRESHIPVDEVDAAVTDQAVESLKPGREALYQTVHAMYIAGCGVRELSRQCSVTEAAIRARLDQADRLLANWFADRQQKQATLRAEMDLKLSSARASAGRR